MSDILDVSDFAGMMMALGEAYSALSYKFSKIRILDAIYTANSKHKANKKSGRVLPLRDCDINKVLQPESVEECDALALSEYMMGCVHAYKLCKKLGCLQTKKEEQPFYNAKKVYESRLGPVMNLSLVGVWKWAEFDKFMKEKQDIGSIRGNALGRMKNSKGHLAKAIHEEDSEWRKVMLKKMVMSALIVGKVKEGMRVNIVFEGGLPVFEEVKEG
jgi:hypothetical protein